MAKRIEVFTVVNDTRSKVMLEKVKAMCFDVQETTVVDVFTINKQISDDQYNDIASLLSNPVSQKINLTAEDFDFALEIGFLPGVTDNQATTAKDTIEDYLKEKLADDESIHSSKLIFIKGKVNEEDTHTIGTKLANELIERITTKSAAEYKKDGGMDTIVPKVVLEKPAAPDQVDLNISEEELLKLGKEGIPNADGTRRGPLALEKSYLEAIKDYFDKEGRAPFDIELESIAQTWSEHCKHTIFASEIDEVKDGLYKGYIKRATNEIRQAKGDKDFCVSVFSDNAGGIIFDDNWVVTDKAETHNSPSALEPFGGSITGIVGVNRDCIGFGKGAKPVINKYGFCVADPRDEEPLYRDKGKKIKALSPRRILDGIVEGVNVGGNCSGIPTPQGFVYFDESFKGKPLVFVGTIGLIPREINGQPSWEKKAKAGDKIVVIGGRVGQDGIHGATFSSEEMNEGSPATAVQIGDPITQKKLSDAIIKEARDMGLYNSITDNGAGGISCSVAEMARECGGCDVDIDKVPLKYPNLEPWKIWISESQERMTLAIPEEKLEQFTDLMNRRGVEVSVIGEFTDSGRCVVRSQGEKIMDLEMDFLHDGVPPKVLKTNYERPVHPEPDFAEPEDLNKTLGQMLARPNIASFEYISRQYDHNVQGGAVIGPVQGPGRVNGVASVTKPVLDSQHAVVCSQGINSTYSHIDTYHMSACAIDTAIRNVIARGGKLEHLALMDNFCWCSSDEPERLGQLKESARACYEYAIEYGTPYISGKDSMFNDFKGFNEAGQPVKISAAPTLLISSISVMKDVSKAVSLEPKFAGDLVYIIGETKAELGASEYFNENGEIGNSIPKVDAKKAIATYKAFEQAVDQRLIASSISPNLGGLGVSLAKMAIAGQLGLEIDLQKVPQQEIDRNDYLLFSESQSRFIVTVDPKRQEEFEKVFANIPFSQIGEVNDSDKLTITGLDGSTIIDSKISELDKNYRSTFKGF